MPRIQEKHDKAKVLYIVPNLLEFGGIQALAKETASLFEHKSEIEIIKSDWNYVEIPLVIRVFLRYTPHYVGTKIYSAVVKQHFLKKEYPQCAIRHYWSLDSALPFDYKPYVVTVHGLEILEKNMRGFRKDAYRKVLGSASAIHANSNFTKKLLLQSFPEIDTKKVVVINPTTPNYDISSKRLGIGEDSTYVVGTLTRFVKRKNVPRVINAVQVLQRRHNVDVSFYLAGDGPERKKILKKLTQSGINYKYFGKISESDKISKFYPALDVFVLPPLQTSKDVEGFGIVFLEANLFGIPVVAADTGGVSDAVAPGVSGLFADPTNPKDIAERIYEILSANKNWRLSTQSWANDFSQKKATKEFESLYRAVLNDPINEKS